MGGNTYLSLAAIILLSVFMLSSNTLIFNNSKIVDENDYLITAISLGQNLIDEAKSKAFDENTIAGRVEKTSELSQVIGKELGEIMPAVDTEDSNLAFKSGRVFDDFDDYNGYVRVVNTKRVPGFKIESKVLFVDELDPNPKYPKYKPSFCKFMEVIVTSPFFSDTVRLNYAITH